MRSKYLLLLCIMGLLGIACNTPSKGRDEAQMKLSNEISSLSKEVYQNNEPMNLEKSESLLKLLTEYTNKYRQDSLSAVYMLDAAQLSSSIGKYQQAEKFYRATIERYPDSPWAKTANQSLQWTGMSDEEIIRKLESQPATQ